MHQTPSDMAVFKAHMDDTLEMLEKIEAPVPKRASGDAGFGREADYEYLGKKA